MGAEWRMEHGRIPRNPSHKVPVCAMLSRASVVVREKRDGNFPQTDSSLQRERERESERVGRHDDGYSHTTKHTHAADRIRFTHSHTL